MQETLNSKKKGDAAFRHKDAKAAVECYTQVGNYYSRLVLILLIISLKFEYDTYVALRL